MKLGNYYQLLIGQLYAWKKINVVINTINVKIDTMFYCFLHKLDWTYSCDLFYRKKYTGMLQKY